jgi:nucleoside-diphosphate-sugar epimerase
VVEALRRAAASPEVVGQTLNVGGGSQVSLSDALGLLSELSGIAPRIVNRDVQHGDVRNTCADTSRIAAVLGFTPSTSLEEGLAAELEWVRSSQRLAAAP